MLFSPDLIIRIGEHNRGDIESFLSRTPIVALGVPFKELAFRLHPVVQVATVNSAAFDVNLKRSLTDFCRGWPFVASFFCDVRLNASQHVLRIGG